MVKRHPDPDFLVEYASGSLSLAPCISVTTHLQFCETCRDSVESLKDIGGEVLVSSDQVEVSDDLLSRVLDCIENDAPARDETRARKTVTDGVAVELPQYVQDLLPAGELGWKKLSPALRAAPISVGEQQFELALHRIDAGGKTPEHDHRGREITVVLKGSFSDEEGVYQPGDFIVREPGHRHRPYAAQNEECVCLSVLEAPIKLTGIKSVLNPFLSFSPS